MQLDEFIAGLSDDLNPLRELALRLRATGYKTEGNSYSISHRQQIAPEGNFPHRVFVGFMMSIPVMHPFGFLAFHEPIAGHVILS